MNNVLWYPGLKLVEYAGLVDNTVDERGQSPAINRFNPIRHKPQSNDYLKYVVHDVDVPSSSICAELPAFSLLSHQNRVLARVPWRALVFVPYVQPSVVFTLPRILEGCYHDTACHDDDSVVI